MSTPWRRQSALARVGRAGVRHRAVAALAVELGVVQLGVQREAIAFQTLDHVRFPQRSAAVEASRMQARHQLAEFALRARPGQRVQVHMVGGIDIGHRLPRAHRLGRLLGRGRTHPLGHPARVGRFLLCRDVQPVVERRRAHRAGSQLLVHAPHVVLGCALGLDEDLQPADVRRRGGGLHVEEGLVLRIQAFHADLLRGF
jgi:hypothetical protein